MRFIRFAFCIAAAAALAACAGSAGQGSAGRTVHVSLNGGEEVPPVSTRAVGRGTFVVGADGSVSGSVTTTGVKGTMAHIHAGERGKNGPVILPLAKNGDTYAAPAGARFTEAQLKAFLEGRLYVNVHSDRHKGGEVRGQLTP